MPAIAERKGDVACARISHCAGRSALCEAFGFAAFGGLYIAAERVESQDHSTCGMICAAVLGMRRWYGGQRGRGAVQLAVTMGHGRCGMER